MPSPFPGMDPFLEAPAIFPDLHDSLITYLREQLNGKLAPPYYSGIASRVWIEMSHRHIGPDANVLRSESVNGGGATGSAAPGVGGVAVAQATQPVVINVPSDEIRESFLEIYHQPGERLVTTIEVLSLSNKSPGAFGRDLYLKKQQEILSSKVHLVEIDLLRAGIHTTAVPLERLREKAGPFDYHVCVHKFDSFEDYYAYPVPLAGKLPVVEIPLLPGDSPVTLDLQAVLDRCYDSGQYARRVRYEELHAALDLTAEQAAWVQQRLRERDGGASPG